MKFPFLILRRRALRRRVKRGIMNCPIYWQNSVIIVKKQNYGRGKIKMNVSSNWEKLKCSKRQIKKIVQKLIDKKLEGEEEKDAYEKLANFRSSYEYPMQSMINHFRKKAFEVDKKAIVVRRLKRIPSILAKVKRGIRMDTMNDIGGIRIIVKNSKMVEEIKNEIVKSGTKNKLIKEYDYLSKSKESGYRGIHLVYGYGGEKKDYKNYRIELQIRSQIQHAWATAVEVVGTFNQENLKAGEGDKEWLNFFQLVSRSFQSIEEGNLKEYQNSNDMTNLSKKIKDLIVINRLKAYKIIMDNIDPKKKEIFYYV